MQRYERLLLRDETGEERECVAGLKNGGSDVGESTVKVKWRGRVGGGGVDAFFWKEMARS